MKLFFRVDRAESLRRGIDMPYDGPTDRFALSVTPENLTGIEREVLAAIMDDSLDCSRYALEDDPSSIKRREFVGDGMVLPQPDLDGLREAITNMLINRDKRAVMNDDARKERRILWDGYVEEAIANPHEDSMRVEIDRDGVLVARGGYASTTVTYSIPGPLECVDNASDEMRNKYAVAVAASEQAREAAIVVAMPALLDIRDKRRVREVTADAAQAAIYARLPQAVRDRDAAGFATEDEIHMLIQRIACSDVDYRIWQPWGEWDESSELDSLSDAEYALLCRYKQVAPANAEVTPYLVQNAEPFPDSAGGNDRKRVCLVTWTVGHTVIRIAVPMDVSLLDDRALTNTGAEERNA